MSKLTLDDIADLRAYERERPDFLRDVIAVKKHRRVSVGPIITFVFENAATVRFQIQEMARVEKLMSDEAIAAELRIYNPLVPEPGHLAATMMLELTSDDALRGWLPRLVGVETMVEFRLGEGDGARVVRCTVDPDHAKQLTREETTASVHYVHFAFTSADIDAFGVGPVALAVTHPAYAHAVTLGPDTVASLLDTLQHGG